MLLYAHCKWHITIIIIIIIFVSAIKRLQHE
jgi:hypothetical protein